MPDGNAQTVGQKFAAIEKRTKVRWLILAILFMVTAVNYADRATIAIAGPVISKDLGLSAVQMGWVFSAFGWAYVVAQLPGGWLLDRYGSKIVYACSLGLWSLFTMAQGLVGFVTGGLALLTLFALRFALGVAESPSFPGNGRVVAAWFPKQERATASAIFNSAQYFATVLFAPLMGWIVTFFGWPWVFVTMGVLGLVAAEFYGVADEVHQNLLEAVGVGEGAGGPSIRAFSAASFIPWLAAAAYRVRAVFKSFGTSPPWPVSYIWAS